jgi:outer membrane lipoprotein carrier protein
LADITQPASRACARTRPAGRFTSFARGVVVNNAMVLFSLSAGTAFAAQTATPLDRFLDGLSTLRVSFAQTLVDSRGRKVDAAGGTLVVSRPGKFRWEIRPDASVEGAGQLLVADGRNLWFFDRDLEQVTVKPMDDALTATPAMLLSGAADVREAFTITSAGDRDGLEWVHVEPRRADADFRGALLGFSRNELRRMILEDKLGQTATIEFADSQRNVPVSAAELSFTPPEGADVIGTPR